MSELHPGMMVTKAVRLKRPLGQGGMGSVWVADHLALNIDVVVKFMSTELATNADAVARFSREASAAAQVKSPHVVQTFDHGVTGEGVPYIVMELLEGTDLAAQLERRGRLPPTEFAALYIQIAKALGKAHAAGIVHRDIKPDNVFLCDGEGGEVFVKVLDFGIAKAETRLGRGTLTGTIMGTPYYMSPEQIVGKKTIDLRADIWSLGVVAFESLTGERPFEGDSVGALTLAIHSATPRTPSSVDPSLPAAFDAWFAKSCAVDPDARFASMKEASRALVQALGAETLTGVPMSLVAPDQPGVSATAETLLSSASVIDSSVVPRPQRVLPLLMGALLVACALVAGGMFLMRARAPEGSRLVAAPAPPREAPVASAVAVTTPPGTLLLDGGAPVPGSAPSKTAAEIASARPVGALAGGPHGAAAGRGAGATSAGQAKKTATDPAPSAAIDVPEVPAPPPPAPPPPKVTDDDIK